MPKKDGGFIASAEPFWLDVQRQIQGLPFVLVDPWAPAENERASRSVRHYRPYPALWEARAMENISQNISSIQGPILVEDMNFTLQTREGLWIQPFEFAQLAKQKIWSPAPLHQALSQKRFSVLILLFDIEKDISSMVSGTRFLPETQKIMQENYQLRTREGNYWIYLPKEQ